MEADGGDFGRVTLLSSYIDDVVSALRSDIQCAWINYEWGGIQCEQVRTGYDILAVSTVRRTV